MQRWEHCADKPMSSGSQAALTRPRVRHRGHPARASKAATEELPDFFIVGHSKCGTTALYEMLRQHPQIYMPVKEPRYFMPELRSRYWRPRVEQAHAPAHARRLSSRCSPAAAPRSADRRGDAGIPALVHGAGTDRRGAAGGADHRDPARAGQLSALACTCRRCTTTPRRRRTFARRSSSSRLRRRGKRMPRFSQAPKALLYSDHVRYAEQLRSYYEAFPARAGAGADLRRLSEMTTPATMRRVLSFLELDEDYPISSVEHADSAVDSLSIAAPARACVLDSAAKQGDRLAAACSRSAGSFSTPR